MFVSYCKTAPEFRSDMRDELNRRLQILKNAFANAKTKRRKIEVRAAYNELASLLYFLNGINFVDDKLKVVDPEVETAYDPLPTV